MVKLLTVKEVAELFHISKPQVRKMIQHGELMAVKVGREYRIPEAASECLLKSISEVERSQKYLRPLSFLLR